MRLVIIPLVLVLLCTIIPSSMGQSEPVRRTPSPSSPAAAASPPPPPPSGRTPAPVPSSQVTGDADGESAPSQELTEAGSIDYVLRMIDSPLEDIQWASDDVVLVLSEKGSLYRSGDGGRAWTNQMTKFPPRADGSSPRVANFIISSADPQYIFCIGVSRGTWFSTDMGASFSEGQLSEIRDVRLHPTRASWLLGSSMSIGCDHTIPAAAKKGDKKDCFKLLHYSHDFGASWAHATSYVVQYDWSLPFGNPSNGEWPSDNFVYATLHSKQEGDQKFGAWDIGIDFYQTTNYFKDSKILVPGGNRFLFGDYSYLFVAAVDPETGTEVQLQISRDNQTKITFQTAILPVELSEHSYSIVDTSEGSVFLHVNHQPYADRAYAGHLYMSDWTGLVYTLSLPYNHRTQEGICDFTKVEGLEGIYMANFIDEELMDEEEAEERSTAARKKPVRGVKGKPAVVKARHERLRTKSVITFDKGGQWSYLPPPKQDSEGKPIRCSDPKECHLHLHGGSDTYGPAYSTATATGLIMATGTIGAYLQQTIGAINTYLSRDAGLTWKEVKKGSHIYEFGDHGGLIVMANDEEESDSILYSWDEGATWSTQKISDEKFQIENIIIEPSSISQQFLVYGTQGNSGVLVYVDFSGLHERSCIGHDTPDQLTSDYESWTPSDGRLNGRCLMGHTITYTRRKAASQCYNPEVFERRQLATDCQCTDEDFQCDYGYERKGEEEMECVVSAKPPVHRDLSQDKDCNNGQKSLRSTHGYRRVPGDTCVGGAKWDALDIQCPSTLFAKAGYGLFFVFIGLALCTLYNMYTQTACWSSFRARLPCAFLRAKDEDYDDLRIRPAPPAHDAHDTENLIGDEEGGKKGKRLGAGVSDFAPLPPLARPLRPVPAIAPVAADTEFDPRGSR